ncbi:High-affinity branched-chain amino acid transport system permease protein LivH [subsurface metagenome]
MIEGILITGLISGGVYALLAVGFSLIFGVARIINLAHTAFYMLAAYLIVTFADSLGLPLVLSIILSIVAVTIIGVFSYKLVLDRVRERETTILIVTIALAIVIQEAVLMGYGGGFRGVPSLISGYTTILGTKVLYQQILTFGVVLVILLGTWALLMKTKLGIAIRSTAQDREVANLMGINVARTGMITMAISVALAAVAGALVAPLQVLGPHMWMHPLVMIMAIVVLGGLGSIKGSLVGAFILGFAETLVVFLAPSGAFLKGAVALAIMLAVILIRPEGLFGVAFEEER